MIKLHVDDINYKYIDILVPFIGIKENDPNDPINGRYDELYKTGKEFLQLSNIDECDFILYNKDVLIPDNDLINKSMHYNKKLFVIYNSDNSDKLNIPNSVILRTSFYSDDRSTNEYAIPAFVDDLIKKYFGGQFKPKNKNLKPIISFCGYDNSPCRRDALNKLKYCKNIIPNFIIRNNFWGGAINGRLMKPEAFKVRQDLVNNMSEGDYAFCARGGGNFSYRFYEAMSMGKIPLFVNSKCVLPFENIIDWKKLCLWVEESEISNIEEIILNFHNSISNEEFVNKQIQCRNIWKEYLSPEGFYSKLDSFGTANP